jgi:hypothetical protein
MLITGVRACPCAFVSALLRRERQLSRRLKRHETRIIREPAPSAQRHTSRPQFSSRACVSYQGYQTTDKAAISPARRCRRAPAEPACLRAGGLTGLRPRRARSSMPQLNRCNQNHATTRGLYIDPGCGGCACGCAHGCATVAQRFSNGFATVALFDVPKVAQRLRDPLRNYRLAEVCWAGVHVGHKPSASQATCPLLVNSRRYFDMSERALCVLPASIRPRLWHSAFHASFVTYRRPSEACGTSAAR